MEEFDQLLEVAAILNGPNGCPWDVKQTFASLQPYLLEEAHEVIEAVDEGSDQELIEELGDLLYVVVFYAKVAQREGRFGMQEILRAVKDKLIRRHPHVFASLKLESEEELARNWEEIKKKEKEGKVKQGPLDSIPSQLPSLAKAQKMAKIFQRLESFSPVISKKETEQTIAEDLFFIVERAEYSGIDAEGALRKYLANRKKLFESK
jgi:uncharacterized protein YabN with tetrapyrrole methylase and pyrophosphatase domain